MKYLHWKFVEEVESKEEAEFKINLLKEIQNHLAIKFAIFQRLEPEWEEISDFESNRVRTIIRARFSITSEDIAGYKGFIKSENNKVSSDLSE